METTTKKPDMHLGRKISRMRELMGIKQETLAAGLGVSQQAVSKLEQSEKIDDDRLEQVAKVLGVQPEVIKNFNEESAINYINSFHDNSISHVIGNYGTYNFNPIEKWVEAIEENKKLYEALLKSEREKVAMLERLLAEGKK